MKLLPKWIMQDTTPAVYDAESVTNLEAIAKLRAAMNNLITEYNAFADQVNAQISEFVAATEQDQEAFETALRQEFQDFIDTVELKISQQNIKIGLEYDEQTESLNLVGEVTENE